MAKFPHSTVIVLTHIKRIENIDPKMFDVLYTAFVQGVTKRSLRRPPIPPLPYTY